LKGKPQYPYTFSRGQDFPVVIDQHWCRTYVCAISAIFLSILENSMLILYERSFKQRHFLN
jgi:hypothetical protein